MVVVSHSSERHSMSPENIIIFKLIIMTFKTENEFHKDGKDIAS